MKYKRIAIKQAVTFAVKRFKNDDEVDLGWKMVKGVGKDVQKEKFEIDWEVAAMIDVCVCFSKTTFDFVQFLSEEDKESKEFTAFWIMSQQMLP